MKVKVFVVIALLCLVSFLLFKKYFISSSSDLLLQYTPDSCGTIILINSNAIQNKLVLDGIQHFSKIDSLKNAWTDGKFAVLFQKALESSIVLDYQIISFNYSGIWGIVLEYTNKTAFHTFISRDLPHLYQSNVDTQQKIIQFIDYPIEITWNDKHLYILHNNSTINKLVKNRLISKFRADTKRALTHSDSILLTNSFERDISAFVQKDVKFDSIPVIKDIKELYASINFEKGAVQISTSLSFDNNKLNYYDSLFTNTSQSIVKKEKESPLSFSICINPDLFLKQTKSKNQIQKIGLNNDALKCWNGQFCYTYQGLDTIFKKYISYDYDDDFNKVATIKHIPESVYNQKLAIGYDNSKLLDSVFNALKKDKMLKNNSGTLQVINAFDQPYFISTNKQWICISGITNDTASFVLNPNPSIFEINLSSKGLQSGFLSSYIEPSFNYDNIQFKKIHIIFKKDSSKTYAAELDITFDSELNGLFELMKNVQTIK